MLSKVSTASITLSQRTLYWPSSTRVFSHTVQFNGTYTVTGTWMSNHGSTYFYVYHNGTQLSSSLNPNINIDAKVWDIISTNKTNNQDDGTVTLKATPTLIKPYKSVLRPFGLKTLWELGYGTLYGVHTDNVYYGGIMIEKDTTATTGNITLGNAVGYIKVNFNGEIIKIPYYNK